MSECVMPDCDKVASPLIHYPICSGHARRIYLHVKDMMQSATVAQVASSAAPPKAPGGMRNRTDQPGHVYFMQMGEGVVKIGFSTDVRARARQLGARKVLAVLPGTRRTERDLHARFGPHWLEGEHFRDCPEIRAYIAEVSG